ncbi:hypothetical protein LTR37_009737 [Vermiconidia calcicola]|uniref:Uncharacterized protein n=1 Tax=Vermiconidia calcicola TaxID=1690605 RepID=A0ACC3N7S8_9PEZI|nr:hypothetical protein LTR37_009737 [Vermiconidia calcicola]
MAAFVPPAGSRMVNPFDGKMMPWLDEDVENDVSHMQDPRHAFYELIVSDVEAQKRVVKDALEYVPYEHDGRGVDATYLMCERDKELTARVQECMATLLGESRRVDYCNAGHCCMIRYAHTIADVVERAWKVTELRLESER